MKWLIGLMASAVLALGLGTAPAAARPAAPSTTCDATLIAKFQPGLTGGEQQQQISIKGRLTACQGGGVSSATGTGSGSGTLSCTSGSARARFRLSWDTGAASRINATVDVATGTVTGRVVKGLFAGERVSGHLTVTPVQGNCLSSPVTKAKATGSVSI